MADRGPVFQLMYRSEFVVPAPLRAAAIASIFEVSRRKNLERDVTGALLVWQEFVVQTLEGAEDLVRALYDEIAADPRHVDVTLVDAHTVDSRTFERWSMARVAGTGATTADDEEVGRNPSREREDTARVVATMREHAARR